MKGEERDLWKADLSRGEVRVVRGTGHPDKDSEGDTIYVNTHFITRKEAVAKLQGDAAAGVELAGRAVEQAKAALVTANERAGEMSERFSRVQRYVVMTSGGRDA